MFFKFKLIPFFAKADDKGGQGDPPPTPPAPPTPPTPPTPPKEGDSKIWDAITEIKTQLSEVLKDKESPTVTVPVPSPPKPPEQTPPAAPTDQKKKSFLDMIW